MSQTRTYFPNLHGLRFFAALMVFVHHVEQTLAENGLSERFNDFPAYFLLGKLGVVLFFVLSGFLITYLLMEEESHSEISIKNFYLRRILRIWPLYYLIVGLSLFVFPHVQFFTIDGWSSGAIGTERWLQIGLYLFLFANLALKLTGPLLHASHTWSIGTEEQFYIVWPVIIKYIKKYRELLLLAIITGYMGLLYFFRQPECGIVPFNVYITKFLEVFNIDCMAIGGLFAVMLYNKSIFIKKLISNKIVTISVATTIVMICFNVRIPYYTYELYAVPFGIIILNLSVNPSISNLLEHQTFKYLGNISYGLYMYQPLIIFLTIKLLLPITPEMMMNSVTYIVGGLLTIGISGLSYRYFESPFLKLKNRYTFTK